MKTIGPTLTLALCLALVLAAVACAGNTTTSAVGPTTTPEASATSTSAQVTTTTAPIGLPNGARDASGDMLSFEPQPTQGPFASLGDLVAVGLEVKPGGLIAHIQTVDDIPETPPAGVDTMIFVLEIWMDRKSGDATYVVGLTLAADFSKQWLATVTDLYSGATTILPTGPTIDGNTLTCSVPLDLLPGLPSSFEWRVSVERGEGENFFTDYAPDVGDDPLNPGLIRFPSP